MRTFAELKNDIAILAQRSGDTDYVSKIGNWVNLSYRYLVDIYDYYLELKEEHSFTTVSGTEDYFMPSHFDKPVRIYDLTNDRLLSISTHEEYFDSNISSIADSTTGKPSVARISGISAINRAISTSGSTLKVKSSSSSDTANVVVRIEGYVDSSKTILDFENITVSSSSPTTYVAGTKTFYKITHISKSANTTGYIIVADSSDNIISYLNSIQRVARYPVMKLGLIPNASLSMRVLFKRKVAELVDDNDYPFVDADEFLILNSLGYALAQEKETVVRAEQFWNKAKDTLNVFLINQNSKLGPNFNHKYTTSYLQAHR